MQLRDRVIGNNRLSARERIDCFIDHIEHGIYLIPLYRHYKPRVGSVRRYEHPPCRT